MQGVSSLYQTEVQRPFAGQALLRVTFGLIDTDAAATCAPPECGAAQAQWSRPDSVLTEDGVPRATYATFEPGRMRADGRQRILPAAREARKAEGLVSAELSGPDGRFADGREPVLRLRFSKAHTVPGLTLTFDTSTGDYASAVRVVARGGGAVVLDKRYAPAAAVFRTPDAMERFDEIELHFLGTVPAWRRLRVQQILFGFGLVFGNAQVQAASHKREVDPITRRLPVNTFDFSIVNVNAFAEAGVSCGGGQYLYDPDNLQGVYRYISEQSPVRVEYGQMLSGGLTWGDAAANTWGELELNGWQELFEGGLVEWVNGGRYYLTAQPTVEGLTAKFKAQDMLSRLNTVYDKGLYAPDGRTLYDLAKAVLTDAALPRLDGDSPPWRLWDGLHKVETSAPLPVKKHKELLQLIAHAGRCTLYTDRAGCICIEPVTQAQDNFKLDFRTLRDRPRVTQIPTLRAVQCMAYSYVAEEKTTQLYSKTLSLGADGTLAVHLSFPAAVEHAATVQGARVVSAVFYTASADLVLEALPDDGTAPTAEAAGGNSPTADTADTRTAKLTVTGRKLTAAADMAEAAVPPEASPDKNGSVEVLENPLITTEKNAAEVAAWVRDYLRLRNTYDFTYRGSPELDCGDLVWLETQFAPCIAPARILKSELSFDGSLGGKMTAKRMVNV